MIANVVSLSICKSCQFLEHIHFFWKASTSISDSIPKFVLMKLWCQVYIRFGSSLSLYVFLIGYRQSNWLSFSSNFYFRIHIRVKFLKYFEFSLIFFPGHEIPNCKAFISLWSNLNWRIWLKSPLNFSLSNSSLVLFKEL